MLRQRRGWDLVFGKNGTPTRSRKWRSLGRRRRHWRGQFRDSSKRRYGHRVYIHVLAPWTVDDCLGVEHIHHGANGDVNSGHKTESRTNDVPKIEIKVDDSERKDPAAHASKFVAR